MGSMSQSPLASHAPTLSALTKEPLEEQTSILRENFTQEQEKMWPQGIKNSARGGWVMARKSRISSRAWNRQIILVFADFNSFERPGGSRSRIAEGDDPELDDSSSQPDYVRSSASSLYSLDKALPEPPYHVFTLAKKKQLVYIVFLAGLFSPLSSNIYFPASGQIATDLKTSITLVSQTITVYMVVQGLATPQQFL